MVRIRIRGLVRAAREAQAGLRTGFAEEERAPFLARVQRVVGEADAILAANASQQEHLPAPSRNALQTLRTLAALPPESLSPHDPAQPSRKRIPVKNVVRTLEQCLDEVAAGPADEERVALVCLDARISADAIERLCASEGGHTAGLPAPSRRAYAMLRWLSQRENADLYAARVHRASAVLPQMWSEITRRPQPDKARVCFKPSANVVRAGPRRDHYAWEFSIGCLASEEEDLRAIVACMHAGRAAANEDRERQVAFTRSEAYVTLAFELEQLADPVPFQARGRAHDLNALFERLDQAFFQGTLEKPHLDWRPMLSRRTFGFYIASLDLVCLNPLLDDPAVPAFVAEVVLYHELLHKKHGVHVRGGCTHAHTAAFRAEERLHPCFEESERWLKALARGQAAPEGAPAPREKLCAKHRKLVPQAEQLMRSHQPGRNEACHCGSGRKYKRCHMALDEAR